MHGHTILDQPCLYLQVMLIGISAQILYTIVKAYLPLYLLDTLQMDKVSNEYT